MSLRFCFNPPPKIRLIKHQRIKFTIGHPHVEFVLHSSQATKETTFFKKEKEVREVKERVPKVHKPILTLKERNLVGCYDLLQQMKNNKRVKEFYELIGTPLDFKVKFSEQNPEILDLRGIELKVSNCDYVEIEDFQNDVEEFLNTLSYTFVDQPEISNTAQRFSNEFQRAFREAPKAETGGATFNELETQLRKFTSVKIGNITETPKTIEAESIADALNKLDGKKRLEAEWLIRIHCPSIPFYAQGIDVTELPYPCIDALVNHLQLC